MKKIILALIVSTSLLSANLFKEDDMKTHVSIGAMTGVWASLLARKHGANETQAFLIGVGAAMAVGVAASGGNMDLMSDAIGGAVGSSVSITIYKW